MRFSLIMGTVGRSRVLHRFLQALADQDYEDLELIVVDQNEDDRLAPILSEYRDRFRLVHLRCPKGLSRARNLGLKQATGAILAFPDDDCWYPRGLLARAASFFKDHPDYHGLTGRCLDEQGRESMGRFFPRAGDIDFFGVWRSLTSFYYLHPGRSGAGSGGIRRVIGCGRGDPLGIQ